MKKFLAFYGLISLFLISIAFTAADMWQPPKIDESLVGTGTHEDPIGVDYDKYVVEITQASTSAPTYKVLHNEIAPDTTYRDDVGEYTIEFPAGTLVNDDTYVSLTIGNATAAIGRAYSITDSTVTWKTYDAADAAADLTGTAYLEVRVVKDE